MTKFLLLMMLIVMSATAYSAETAVPIIQSEQKTLVVGSEQSYPPFATGMTDATAGGFSVELWRAIAAEAGLKYTLRVLPFRQLLQEFKEGEIDVLVNLAISKERRQFADFSVPDAIVTGAIFVRKNETGIQSGDNLSEQSIIVIDRDLAHDYAISKGWGKQLVLVDTTAEGMKLLALGKHDVMLTSKFTGLQSLLVLGLSDIKALDIPAGFSYKFAVAVPRGHPELLSQINEAMAVTNTNGIYTALYDKWLGIYEGKELELRDIFKYISPLIVLFLVITVYFYYRRQVERKIAVSALIEKEERLQLSLASSKQNWFELNPQTGEILSSPNYPEMLGYDPAEFYGNLQNWQDNIHPDDYDAVMIAFRDCLSSDSAVSIEYRRCKKDGSWLWFCSTARVSERGLQQQPLRMTGIHADITERKLAEEKLKLAASVFSNAREGIFITDVTGTIIDVNDTFTDVTGYGRKEAIGQNPRIFQSGHQSPDFYVNMWQVLLEKRFWSGEVWNRRKNGEVYAQMLNISAVKDASGQINNYVALFTDITLMKEHQRQLERIAHYDVLTNLPNRVLLADRLSQAMLQCDRHSQSLAVLFLDLDGFKHVNDLHGHDVGDELLIALSLLMKEVLREGDTLARLGGDEFVAVLTDLAKVEDCEPILERLLLAASELVTVDDLVLKVSASIGVTLYPQDSADADQLVRHADQAMYIAKESGKDRYHLFDTAQDDAIKMQRENLEAIRSALELQQFVLYYQPKVNMRTGTVIGVEALIRWQHPQRGLLNPIEFLPVIENHAMMIDVGEWVIDTALTQISQWQAMDLDLAACISVNIAAVQLQQTNFVDKLNALLAAHPDVRPHYLELEVLETSALDDVAHVSEIMTACMALGVNFALDDFGTGYSSLTYLRNLPTSLIKIDQTFVRDMLEDADDLAIVDGVIGLARSFKRDVIAEGVETIEHGTALLQLGCELAQGYGIARPMPADDIPTWVSGWKPDDAWREVDVK